LDLKLGILSLLLLGSLPAQTVDDADDDSTAQSGAQSYQPMTLGQRYKWVAKSSISPRRMAGFLVTSAMATAGNAPREYGTHWDGFAKRIGIRASSSATGMMMEASLGALWGEDPRYMRATGQPLKARLLNIVKMTFMARDPEGKLVPAYARYIAVPGNSFLTNTWRADSHATTPRALARIPLTFGTRAISNSISEFWPDIKRKLHRH
jgi:hypothetical protein